MTIRTDLPKFPEEGFKTISEDIYEYILTLHTAVEILTDKVNELDERVTALEP